MNLLISCSSRPVRKIEMARKQATKHLYKQLEARNLIKSGQYIVYLGGPRTEKEKILFAQFHLMSCNFKKSLDYLKEVNRQEKVLMKAVISGIVSIERNSLTKERKKAAKNISYVYPIDSGEVWPDEWKDIGAKKGYCQKIGTSKKKYRKFLKNLSLDSFKKIPDKVLLRDFDLVSLGVDLGYKFQKIDSILDRFKSKKDNPYYKYLESLYFEENEGRLNVEKKNKKGEITLSTFKIRTNRIEPKEIKIPFVLGENFL